MKNRMRFMFLFCALCAYILPAQASWILVDDFETLVMTGDGGAVLLNTEGTNGPHTNNNPDRVPYVEPSDGGWFVMNGGDENGTNDRNWRVIEDPENAANKVLALEDEYDSSLVKTIPGGAGIMEGGQGTLYFRYYSLAGESPSVGAGLLDAASDADPGNTGPYVNLNDGSTGADNATIVGYETGGNSDGGSSGSTEIAGGMAESTWYSIWIQADDTNVLTDPPNPNTLDSADPGNPLDGAVDGTYSVYIAGGAYGNSPTLLASDLQYRQNPIGDLTRVILRPNNANTHDGDAVYFDDIYFTPALTLTNPVPEPSTVLLTAAMLAGLSGYRRFA